MTLITGATLVFVVTTIVVGGFRHTTDAHRPEGQAQSVSSAPQSPAAQAQPATHTAPQNPGPVVGHLKTRDKLITIRTGPNGPLYTVKSHDGQTIAADLPATELSAKFPDLKQVVELGTADWAGMDLGDYHVETW